MKKLIVAGAAVLLALGVAAASVAPAGAYPYYPHHHYYGGYGPGAGLAAGILGFAAGAAIAGAAEDRGYDDDRGHVDACLQAYKSYDVRSDTYLGYDGYRHRCEL